MEKEIIAKQFDQIEEKVTLLISKFKALESTNITLQNEINHLQNEIQHLREQENRHDEERQIVKSKVEYLLEKLQDVSIS